MIMFYLVLSVVLGIAATATALDDGASAGDALSSGAAVAVLWPAFVVLMLLLVLLYLVFLLPAKLLLRWAK